ncbi:MAG: hypothetical protein HZA91_02050 [Verrucomicrobia bacterium]|nr:hypothetical protein [Verrucomicrobiota bacterium]
MKFFLSLALAAAVAVAAETTPPKPAPAKADAPIDLSDMPAVIAALRAHYMDPSALGERELNEASVRGILDHLGHGAKIIEPPRAGAVVETPADMAKSDLIGEKIHYIRFGKLGNFTAGVLDSVMAKVPCDKTYGIVLDLRFVQGSDFADAAAVAGRFLPKGAPLFMLKGAAKDEPRRFGASFDKGCVITPLIVLVNAGTSGSAEALAAALRDQQRAVILGSVTAGEAAERVELPLVGGKKLTLAVKQAVLPDGSRIFPAGVMPDVPVKMDADLQRKLLLGPDAQKDLRASLEPKVTKRRINEAELVRALESDEKTAARNGKNGATPAPAAKPQPEPPAEEKETRNENAKVEEPADVVLTRALDILKGLRTLRRP